MKIKFSRRKNFINESFPVNESMFSKEKKEVNLLTRAIGSKRNTDMQAMYGKSLSLSDEDKKAYEDARKYLLESAIASLNKLVLSESTKGIARAIIANPKQAARSEDGSYIISGDVAAKTLGAAAGQKISKTSTIENPELLSPEEYDEFERTKRNYNKNIDWGRIASIEDKRDRGIELTPEEQSEYNALISKYLADPKNEKYMLDPSRPSTTTLRTPTRDTSTPLIDKALRAIATKEKAATLGMTPKQYRTKLYNDKISINESGEMSISYEQTRKYLLESALINLEESVNKYKAEKIIKTYAEGGWRRALSLIADLGIAAVSSLYGMAMFGLYTWGGPLTLGALGVGLLTFLIIGSYGELIKALLLGTDDILRKNPKMKKLFELAKEDKESSEIISDIKKEMDKEKPNESKLKEHKKQLEKRLKQLETKNKSLKESVLQHYLKEGNLFDNIRKKRKRIEKGSKERMKKPSEKGYPHHLEKIAKEAAEDGK
jgi:hypothetical protein